MNVEIRHAAIREIEKAGGRVRCSIRDGEHVVTVQHPSGAIVRATSSDSYDFERALQLYLVAKSKHVKIEPAKEAAESPRTRPKARTRVVASPAATAAHTSDERASQPVEADRLSLKERLKLRNQAKVA